jgi:hypothetical protein
MRIKSFRIFERHYRYVETDNWSSDSSVSHYVEYSFATDKYSYICVFNKIKKSEYVREFFCDSRPGDPYSLTNDDVWGVLGTVTEITRDFIDKYHPDTVKILHIKDEGETGKSSKRAVAVRRFLERMLDSMPDYDIRYVGDVTWIMRSEN